MNWKESQNNTTEHSGTHNVTLYNIQVHSYWWNLHSRWHYIPIRIQVWYAWDSILITTSKLTYITLVGQQPHCHCECTHAMRIASILYLIQDLFHFYSLSAVHSYDLYHNYTLHILKLCWSLLGLIITEPQHLRLWHAIFNVVIPHSSLIH